MAVNDDYELKFGPFVGKTLKEVGDTYAGLRYLDRLLESNWVYPPIKKKVKEYLQDPNVKHRLDAALENMQ